jgi:hypothetical protein
MIAIRFDKRRAEYLLDCLRTGKPIAPSDPSRGWTQFDMLALAGACHFAAMSRGPALHATGVAPLDQLPPEHREAAEENWDADLHGAIGWYSQVTMLVADGEYDQHFEPQHEAFVEVRGEARRVKPGKGFRQTDADEEEEN